MTKNNLLAILLLVIAGLLAWPLFTAKWPVMRGALAPMTAMLPGATTTDVSRNRTVEGYIRVIDGDTVAAGGDHYRLLGFDTPEKGDLARCESERLLAARATARLQDMIARRDVRLTRVACACPPDTEGTWRCNHGRLCGALTVDGRDVGDILIRDGLAHRYVCSGDRCPRRLDWC